MSNYEAKPLILTDLPDIPKNQWWKIEHNPKSQTKPIKITLMEHFIPEVPPRDYKPQNLPSRAIGSIYTVAAKGDLIADAEKLAHAASGYALVVGEFGK